MFLEGVCPIKPSLFIASAHYSYFLHEYSCGESSRDDPPWSSLNLRHGPSPNNGIAASGRGKITHEVGQVSLSCSGRDPHRFANRVGGAGGIGEDGPPVGSSTSAMPNDGQNRSLRSLSWPSCAGFHPELSAAARCAR